MFPDFARLITDPIEAAIRKFQRDYVDLESGQSTKAKASRDFLFTQIQSASSQTGFPKLLSESPIPFGSFARRTKRRPLDDIDMLLLLDGHGLRNGPASSFPYRRWVKIVSPESPMARFPDSYGYVNSTKILNALKEKLSRLSHYKKADISRNGEAVTVELTTSPWAFDIVPAFAVLRENGNGISHYLVPDGGDWKPTDPRFDSARIDRLDDTREKRFRPVCRLLKFWNGRTHKPVLSSYYFESIVCEIFKTEPIISLAGGIQRFFEKASSILLLPMPDPKGLSLGLDTDVSWDTKQKVSAAIEAAKGELTSVFLLHTMGLADYRMSAWKSVFGPSFGL